GKHLAAATDAGVLVWEMETRRRLYTLPGRVTHAVFSPDGQRLATAIDKQKVTVRSFVTGEVLLTLGQPVDTRPGLAFSADGGLLAASGDQATVTVWEMPSGQERYSLPSQGARIMAIAFSPDGRYLATTAYGREIQLWDALTGRLLQTLREES